MVSLKIIKSDQITEEGIQDIIPRNKSELDSIRESVQEIINEVKTKGDTALIRFAKEFDKVDLELTQLQVNKNEIEEAYENIDQGLLKAFRHAKNNLIKFHQAQKREDWSIEIEKGVKAGQIYRPLNSVGLYIPGGRAIYPSSVLMAATPASIAGVNDIIICTPPQSNGKVAPEIIVAAREFSIEKIFKVGGAQAIAAMAFGTKTVPKIQKVIGPGNKWVNAAKQLLSNVVAIDTPAGPSEILIIADESANVDHVIIDFISQIEHDPDNIGIIVTESLKLIDAINENLEKSIDVLERKDIIRAALKNCMIIRAKDIDDCIRISEIIAPEHLEILTQNPRDLLGKINNAGAIFLGPFSPVPLGDYSAGTNHILPTGGNAKKYSGLNIYEFLKIIDVLECNEEGLKNLSESSLIIAEFEGLTAHKKAIEERLKEKN